MSISPVRGAGSIAGFRRFLTETHPTPNGVNELCAAAARQHLDQRAGSVRETLKQRHPSIRCCSLLKTHKIGFGYIKEVRKPDVAIVIFHRYCD